MNIKQLTIAAICLLATSSSFAQIHSCGTDSYLDICKKKDPSLIEKENTWNIQAKAYKHVERRATKYTIPVVFHVIHVNGEGNISREQILDQMRILNEDFSFTNPNKSNIRADFTNDAANFELEFKLAKIDPNGKCTNGINRVYSTYTNEVSQTDEEVKYLPGVQWDYQKYLNVYVVNSIDNNGGTGTILGYATFPFATSSVRDGIVVRHDRVGNIGTAASANDGGRTLTHEIGHWLGLYHTFQGGCRSGFGDGCDDTPPVASTFTNQNCPSNGNSCSTDNPNRIDMWENYMDYSRGTCMALFTHDQKTRAYSQLTKFPRLNLHSAANLVATGVEDGTGTPLAFFSASQRVVCAGTPIKFYDNTCKAGVDSRIWTFTGGSPTGTTLENPTVVYNTPGEYEVKLQVTNSSGSNTTTESKYITVLPAQGGTPNYVETFEDINAPDFNIEPIFSSGIQWEQNAGIGYKSNKCYQAKVTSATPVGSVFSIKLPAINLKELQGQQPRLSFFTSYAPHTSGSNTETLRVLISTDCGQTYQSFIQRVGAGLAYPFAPAVDGFIPAGDDQWRLINFSLTNYDSEESAIFRFDVESNGGNSVYIDDINVGKFVAALNDVQSLGISIYPNPSKSEITISLKQEQLIKKVTVRDLAGRIVAEQSINQFSSSTQFKNSKNLKGLYLVSINTDLGESTSSVVFE